MRLRKSRLGSDWMQSLGIEIGYLNVIWPISGWESASSLGAELFAITAGEANPMVLFALVVPVYKNEATKAQFTLHSKPFYP